MGIFRGSGVQKIAAVAALAAALASACTSRSDEFLKLVEPKDRAAAALLMRDDAKKDEWENLHLGITHMDNYIKGMKILAKDHPFIRDQALSGLITVTNNTLDFYDSTRKERYNE